MGRVSLRIYSPFSLFDFTKSELLTIYIAGFPAIVTRFHLLTRPLPEMYQSIYIWPVSEYHKVLKWVIDVSPPQNPCNSCRIPLLTTCRCAK